MMTGRSTRAGRARSRFLLVVCAAWGVRPCAGANGTTEVKLAFGSSWKGLFLPSTEVGTLEGNESKWTSCDAYGAPSRLYHYADFELAPNEGLLVESGGMWAGGGTPFPDVLAYYAGEFARVGPYGASAPAWNDFVHVHIAPGSHKKIDPGSRSS